MILLSAVTQSGTRLAVKTTSGIVVLEKIQKKKTDLPLTLQEALLVPGGLDRVGDFVREHLSDPTKAGKFAQPESTVQIAPLFKPRNLLCIGLNYKDHAAEGGVPLPEKPVVFAKLTGCIIAAGEPIVLPPDTNEVDYEAELAVVIGRRCRSATTSVALNYVAGYTCLNDISARDFQRGDGQWVRAKSQDTFGPMGPYLVTSEDVPDPQTLANSLLGQWATAARLQYRQDDFRCARTNCIYLAGDHSRTRRRDQYGNPARRGFCAHTSHFSEGRRRSNRGSGRCRPPGKLCESSLRAAHEYAGGLERRSMKITKLETIWFEAISDAAWRKQSPHSRQALPNNLWIRIFTDDGLVGVGETYYLPRAVSAIIHDLFAPLLIGRNPLDIENHWNNLFSLVNFCGFAGAEMRAISAIDVALWDLAGQHAGEPIYNLLGGRNRESILVYNTCVGYGKYPDYDAWMERRAGELAQDLLNHGIKAMKIWPFDQFGTTLAGPAQPRGKVSLWGQETAAGTLGHLITDQEIKAGLAILDDIRNTTGDAMAVAIEGHSRWDLPAATRIARALEPYNVMWLEEIMPPDNVDAFVRLKASTRVPLCQSERVFTRFRFREFIEKPAADIIMPDLSWGGGFTETRKICSFADTYYLPITLHDTIGPVALWAALHLMMHIPNAMIQEVVRGYVDGWYNDVLTDPLVIDDGQLRLNGKPGLGTTLRDDLTSRPGVHVDVTTEEHVRSC